MHQKIESGKKFLIQTLVSVSVTFIFFFLLHFLVAWLLMRVDHFDGYWNLVSWVIVSALSVFHSFLYGKSFSLSLCSSLGFSFISAILSFAFGGEHADFTLIFLRLLAFVGMTVLIGLFLRFSAQKNKRKKKIRFRP